MSAPTELKLTLIARVIATLTRTRCLSSSMITVGLLVRLEAKKGKENEVANFLSGALPIVQSETGTAAWFAIRIGPSTFGIFDVFPDEAGRKAHLAGQVAAALMAKAPELFANPPTIEKVDVLASKLPAGSAMRGQY